MKSVGIEGQGGVAPDTTAGRSLQVTSELASPLGEQNIRSLQTPPGVPETSVLEQPSIKLCTDQPKTTSEENKIGGKRPANETESNTNKATNAKIKQPGRWLQDEHDRFIKGISYYLLLHSYRTIWEEVEEG